MKIEAYIDIIEANTGNVLDTATIDVDADYVEANEESIVEWIENSDDWNEISSNWQNGGKLVQFDVTNMQDIIEDIELEDS